AYTLEEDPNWDTPFMGSTVHAKSLKDKGIVVRGMVSLEMIGYFADNFGSQSYPVPFLHLVYPQKGNFISIVGDTNQRQLIGEIKKAMQASVLIEVYSFSAPQITPGLDYSDHLSYWKHGYPAVMITDTAYNRNHHYHTVDDTAEKLDYPRMAQVVNGVFYYLQELSP
ncbi:MAG: M28 family peptidase, partial [Pseudomonadota bacterium]